MKFILLVFVLSVAAPSYSYASDKTVKSMVELLLTLDDLNNVLGHKISGAGAGLMAANSALKHRGDKPLYCQPAKLKLNTRNYVEIMKTLIDEKPVYGDREPGLYQLVLVDALIYSFPCE